MYFHSFVCIPINLDFVDRDNRVRFETAFVNCLYISILSHIIIT